MIAFHNSKKSLYKGQAGRLFCLLAVLIIGCAVIVSTGLLIRSNKDYQLNRSLTDTGDYDGIIYDVPIGSASNLLENCSLIKESGSYLEVGMVSPPGSQVSFKGAVFKDGASEQLYHMPCIRGTYPHKNDEVVIDVSVAQTMGIPPYPGEIIELVLFDEDGNMIKSSKYMVSGIIEASSDLVWGGWYRYPSEYNDGEYLMPSIFFCNETFDSYKSGNEVCFVQAQEGIETSVFIREMRAITSQIGNGSIFEFNDRRANALASSMGILDIIQDKYGDISYSSVSQAINEGFGIKDFFSSILIPAICVLILLIEIFAINMLSRTIIADRKDYYGILRLLGVSSLHLVADIIIEFTILGVIGFILGTIAGISVHYVMIWLVNLISNVKLESGLFVSEAVKVVTYNPVILCFFVCIVSLWTALLIPVVRIGKMTPVKLLSLETDMFTDLKKNTPKKTKYNDGWLFTFCRRISLHDNLTLLALTAVLSVMLFGYCYFCAYSDYSNIEYKAYLNENNMNGYDYIGRRSTQIQDASYMISNRHDVGISHDSMQTIISSGMTNELYAIIRNGSTRLIFDEEPDPEHTMLLGNHNLKLEFDDSGLGRAGERGQAASWRAMGFDPSCYMYEVPTVGIREEELEGLKDYTVVGNIDVSAIAAGDEVIIAVPEYLLDSALKYYSEGKSISFSDILLTDSTDKIDFNSQEAYDDKYHVYEETVKDEKGDDIFTFASAYGTRHDIRTTIGAIVVLDDRLSSIYLDPDNKGIEYYYDEETGEEVQSVSYGMAILVNDCLTFKSWGLPDRNYTNVKATLKPGVDINEFDQMWYKALANSKDVETISSYYYLSKIQSGTMEIMSVFYLIAISFIILGSVSVSVGLYAKVRRNTESLMALRRIGLSVKQGVLMILIQNIYYPVIAAMISIIPVFMCQSLFMFIKQKLQSGAWESSFFPGAEPWYASLPYQYSLFDYNFPLALGLCILTGVLLILLGSLPQILFLNKHTIIEAEE